MYIFNAMHVSFQRIEMQNSSSPFASFPWKSASWRRPSWATAILWRDHTYCYVWIEEVGLASLRIYKSGELTETYLMGAFTYMVEWMAVLLAMLGLTFFWTCSAFPLKKRLELTQAVATHTQSTSRVVVAELNTRYEQLRLHQTSRTRPKEHDNAYALNLVQEDRDAPSLPGLNTSTL